ncbi:MAG: cyclase family protein [Spirochaetia bacterium]
MTNEQFIDAFGKARQYDLTQPLSIYTPPVPHDHSLQLHFFKRVTGAHGGGQGANGMILKWSNTVGTHLVGETSFHSGARPISDIQLNDLAGEGVVADISGEVSDYGLYTPEMITGKVDVRDGDILIIYTGYSRYSWERPESDEFGYLVRHPGPSPEFFDWAISKKLKWIGVDCGSAEHPMNTPIRFHHDRDFDKAERKLVEKYGKSWDEMFPQSEYYELTHKRIPDNHLLFVESIGGEVAELADSRAWIVADPVPMVETEAAWTRVMAYTAAEGISENEFFAVMHKVKRRDLTSPFSVRTPQWLNYKPLTVEYHKRVGGQQFGMGRNGTICEASIHLATHMDGEIHFYPAGRPIGQVPMDRWVGPGVVADISAEVSNSSVYTPKMVENQVEVREGDILILKTGWARYGWASPEADEFRYMVEHPGPSPDFAEWAIEKKIKWIGVDCVSADHPMQTIMRLWHPKTFEVANQKLIDTYGKDWDEMYPIEHYYQDMHLNLFPSGIVHAENLSGEILEVSSGRYYIGAYMPKAIEAESMWGRFVLWEYPE